MIAHNVQSFNAAYEELGKHFLEGRTQPAYPRNYKVHEIPTPVAWTVENSWECWLTAPGRRLNPFFACAEVIWILSGNGNVEWISRFNKTMRNFADEGEEDFNAPYGKRIHKYELDEHRFVNQYYFALNALDEDPQTRQAVICLWHPLLDNKNITNDRACNNIIYFTVRNDKLHTTVVQRSNDFYLGTPYNSIQFAHLAMLMAGDLGVELGSRTQVVNNLHVYLEGFYDYREKGIPKPRYYPYQKWCNSPITHAKFRSALDRFNEVAELPHLAMYLLHVYYEKLLTEVRLSQYWRQLFTMPVLYLIKKGGKASAAEIIEWMHNRSFGSLFMWLAEDFFGMEGRDGYGIREDGAKVSAD